MFMTYYGGHGIMKNNTVKCVMNHAANKRTIFYPLEQQLRSLSKEVGGYWIGLFDCCREELKIELTRGLGDDSIMADEGDQDQNLILIFGC